MSPKKQEFIRGHLLTSYVNAEWFRKDNMVYIIMGEVPKNNECENIANSWDIRKSTHADNWYYHIICITPHAIIKACWWNRWDLKKYIDKHPELDFLISSADDSLSWETATSLQNKEEYGSLKEILKKEHLLVNKSSWNYNPLYRIIFNETHPWQSWWSYSAASVNSEINNKNTIPWYNPDKNNIFLDDSWSKLLIWEWFWPWNRIFPFIPIVQLDNVDISSTTSSYPTAAASSTQWNFLSILKSNYPWTTLEDANTILINKYYIEQPYYYKDTDWSIKEWGKWYFIDVNKFINEEILHKSSIEAIQLNSDNVELPSFPWLCYEWYWIQFECDWKRYDCTEDSKLINFIKQKKTIKWFSNKKRFLQYWWKWVADIKVFYLNTNWEIIPDLQINNISKSVN